MSDVRVFPVPFDSLEQKHQSSYTIDPMQFELSARLAMNRVKFSIANYWFNIDSQVKHAQIYRELPAHAQIRG